MELFLWRRGSNLVLIWRKGNNSVGNEMDISLHNSEQTEIIVNRDSQDVNNAETNITGNKGGNLLKLLDA